jgi:hypothetical protein
VGIKKHAKKKPLARSRVLLFCGVACDNLFLVLFGEMIGSQATRQGGLGRKFAVQGPLPRLQHV